MLPLHARMRPFPALGADARGRHALTVRCRQLGLGLALTTTVACLAPTGAPLRSLALPGDAVAEWPESPDFVVLQLDTGHGLGVVRVFGDGRVAAHRYWEPRRSDRDLELRLTATQLDELVRFVADLGVLGYDEEAARRETEAAGIRYDHGPSHPVPYHLQVQLARYRGPDGEEARPYERRHSLADLWTWTRLEDRTLAKVPRVRGLVAVMRRLYEFSDSPELRRVEGPPAAPRPAWAGAGGGPEPRVLFEASFGRPARLGLTDWLGNGTRVLATIPNAAGFSLSPEGSAVAYFAKGLSVLDLASGEARVLVPEATWAHSALWSPAGDAIAFSAHLGARRYHLFTVEADGSNLRALTNEGAKPLQWSPDGRWIYYESQRIGVTRLAAHHVPRPNIFVTGLEGFGRERVVRWRAGEFELSPDGRHAVYRAGDHTSHDEARMHCSFTWRVKLDPRTGAPLPGAPPLSIAAGGEAAWSPDGRWLAISRGRSSEAVRSDGGLTRTLFRVEVGNAILGNLRWSPDGGAILFVQRPLPVGSASGARSEIWVMGRDGSEPRYLTEGGWAEWLL